MANSRQIRTWARDNGMEVSDAGPLSTDVRRAYREAHEESPTPDVSIMDEAPPVVEEVAPKVTNDEPVLGRVINRAKRATKPAAGRGRKVMRNSTSHILGFIYGGLAAPVSKVSAPVAMMMGMQTEVAGEILDPVIAGTVIDKMLQPFAKINDKMEPIHALVTPLICVAIMDKFPEHMDRVTPQLRKALATWAKIAKPHMDALKEQEEKFNEEFGKDIDEYIEIIKNAIILSHVQKEHATAAESWG